MITGAQIYLFRDSWYKTMQLKSEDQASPHPGHLLLSISCQLLCYSYPVYSDIRDRNILWILHVNCVGWFMIYVWARFGIWLEFLSVISKLDGQLSTIFQRIFWLIAKDLNLIKLCWILFSIHCPLLCRGLFWNVYLLGQRLLPLHLNDTFSSHSHDGGTYFATLTHFASNLL